MKIFFWIWGVGFLVWSAIPSSITATWLGISHDNAAIVREIDVLVGVFAFGIIAILNALERR